MSPRLRTRALGALGAIALGALIYALVLVYVSNRYELPQLDGRTFAYLTIALVAHLVALWLFGLLFRRGSRLSGVEISLGGALRAALVAGGVARLIPAGGAITPAAMAWTVRREARGTAGAAVRATVMTYGMLVLVTGVALVAERARGTGVVVESSTVVIGVALIIVGLLLLAGPARLRSVVNRLPHRIRTLLAPTAANESITLPEIGLLAARLALEMASLGAALRAFGIELSPLRTAAAFGIAQLIGGIPGLPGGLGIVEASLVGVLAALGYRAGVTVAPVMMYRVIAFWIPALAGLIAGGWAWLGGERPAEAEVPAYAGNTS